MLQPNTTTTVTSSIPITFAGDEYKYAVADILTSLASGEASTPITPNSIFSTATSTTDLLTPTTLASLEQSLADLQEGTSSSKLPTRESGFIPPVVKTVPSSAAPMVKQEYSDFIYSDDSSLEQDTKWFQSGNKRSRFETNAIVIQPYSPASTSSVTSTTTNRRRRLKDENLTPEEMERRNIRRERNKLAAAKCRQRRVDLTNKLIVESEGLEEEQSKLEHEIQMLQQQKEQLEFLLEAHKPVCSAKVALKQSAVVKTEKPDTSYPSILSVSGASTSTYQATSTTSTRPNTLPIPSKTESQTCSSISEATGVSITTPSSVFNFGLEVMVDGHTGLTPITGTPSCASQIQRNSTDGSSSSENLSSPTTLMAL